MPAKTATGVAPFIACNSHECKPRDAKARNEDSRPKVPARLTRRWPYKPEAFHPARRKPRERRTSPGWQDRPHDRTPANIEARNPPTLPHKTPRDQQESRRPLNRAPSPERGLEGSAQGHTDLGPISLPHDTSPQRARPYKSPTPLQQDDALTAQGEAPKKARPHLPAQSIKTLLPRESRITTPVNRSPHRIAPHCHPTTPRDTRSPLSLVPPLSL